MEERLDSYCMRRQTEGGESNCDPKDQRLTVTMKLIVNRQKKMASVIECLLSPTLLSYCYYAFTMIKEDKSSHLFQHVMAA